MNRWSITSLALLLFCSSIFATDWSQFDGYDIYPVKDKTNCVFPFNYQSKSYTDCTIDGDNGDLPWCSMTTDYAGLISYCYDFRKTPLQCLSNYTMPNKKTYTGCDYLSTSAVYKQCQTNSTKVKYRYCTDALSSNGTLKPLALNDKCNSTYRNLSSNHTMCFGPSPYSFVIALTDDEKQAILDIHNDYRRGVTSRYMFKLYWDDTLAQMAQAHSNLCIFEHDLAVNRLTPQYNWKNGQNIVMSSEVRSSPASLIDMMLSSEQPNFHYGSNCSPGDNTCLHYTQAMISNLTRVGCAQTHCVFPDRIQRHITCNYIQSQYEDNYRTPYVESTVAAADCPSNQDNGLCDCGNRICAYDKGEYLHPANCTCVKPKSKRSVRSVDENERELIQNEAKTGFAVLKTADRPKPAKRDLLRLKRSKQRHH